jgi:acid phosphatase family membrane protein YuiD
MGYTIPGGGGSFNRLLEAAGLSNELEAMPLTKGPFLVKCCIMSMDISLKAVSLKAFFENPVFLSAVSSWFIAQVLKAVVITLSRRRSVREILETIIWRTGGMPSSHSALVSSMAASVAFLEGVHSNLFVVSFFFALIVMRDAMGVRRSSGLQARTLNTLGKQIGDQLGVDFHPVKEVHGHAPLEVVLGSLLGIFIAAAYALL